jgi:glycosyltransferase involved in cell wall biosynthesis
MSPRVSIVIPAYNEATRLVGSIRKLLEFLNQHRPGAELIVVDDGSTDNTADVAEHNLSDTGSVIAKVIRNSPNRGKGHAVRVGMLAATAPVALFTDADLSTPIDEAPKLTDPIEAGACDVAFGSRALDRTLIGVHQPWQREQGGRVFNLIVRVATGLPFWDTQCGFKAFRLDVCRPLIEAAVIDRFAFDVELLYLAHVSGLRLSETPVRWDNDPESKISLASDSVRMVRQVLGIRENARRGEYNEAINRARVIAKSNGMMRQRTVAGEG